MLMDNQVTPETTDQEILNVSWYNLEKLIKPLNTENLIPGTPMNAPYLLVEFLIESFAIDQPEQLRHIEHKNFEEKQIMHLKMPFSMPLSFKTEGDKIQVGFFDLPDFSSDDMNEFCSMVLTTLSQREMLVITINEVDKTFSFSYLDELSKELDFVYLYSEPTENQEMETISFTIKIMQYNWSNEKQQAILGRISKMFNNSSIFKCGLSHSPSDNSKYYLNRYTSLQLQFPNIEKNGSHEPSGKTTSTMSVETLPMYP